MPNDVDRSAADSGGSDVRRGQRFVAAIRSSRTTTLSRAAAQSSHRKPARTPTRPALQGWQTTLVRTRMAALQVGRAAMAGEAACAGFDVYKGGAGLHIHVANISAE